MVKITEVLFRRAEGPSELCGTWKSFPSIGDANSYIRSQSGTFCDTGYDKCDFKIKFEIEDYLYEGRLDVKNPFKNPTYSPADNDIYLHVTDWLNWRLKNDLKGNEVETKDTVEFMENLKLNYFA